MLEPHALCAATREKYKALFRFVQQMRVRQKRHLFYVLRNIGRVRSDTFLPEFGLHCGEFACFQILSEHSRKETKRECSFALPPCGSTPPRGGQRQL